MHELPRTINAKTLLSRVSVRFPLRHDRPDLTMRSMNQTPSVIFVSVVRDPALYRRCVSANSHIENAERVFFDNRELDEPVPVLYNRFLAGFDLSRDAWIVFCHEDFELLEEPCSLLKDIDADSLWGPIGARRRTWFGAVGRWQLVGVVEHRNRQGEFREVIGRSVARGTIVDTFDCQCLIVHSSLFRNHPTLRFDESMCFDFYVEDFCIAAKKQGIPSRILPMECAHDYIRDNIQRGTLPESYYRTQSIIDAKYPLESYAGPCSWIGGDRIGRHITGWLRRLLP